MYMCDNINTEIFPAMSIHICTGLYVHVQSYTKHWYTSQRVPPDQNANILNIYGLYIVKIFFVFI